MTSNVFKAGNSSRNLINVQKSQVSHESESEQLDSDSEVDELKELEMRTGLV